MNVDEGAQAQLPHGGPPLTATAKESSSDELRETDRSKSRARPKRCRQGAQARDDGFDGMRDMKEALRSVITAMNVATKTDLAELDLRIQKVEDEIGKLPDMVAAEVSRQLQEKGASGEAPRASGERSAFVPTSLMVRGWDPFGRRDAHPLGPTSRSIEQERGRQPLHGEAGRCKPPVVVADAQLAAEVAFDLARNLRQELDAALTGLKVKG